MNTTFAPISLSSFLATSRVHSDIYIRLEENKYVKILKKGQSFEKARLSRYKGLEIKTLYMCTDSLRAYNQKGLEICHAISARAGLSPTDRLKVLSRVSEGVLAEAFHVGIDDESMGCAESVIRQMIYTTNEVDVADNLYKAVLVMGDDFARHSVLVCLLSVFLAKKMKWRGTKLLRSIAVAGFFHDIGFKDIPGNLHLRHPGSFNSDEIELYRSHPKLSVAALQGFPEISAESISAIADHHEQPHGRGFPQALAAGHIYPLSRLIFVADFLANLTIRSEKYPQPKGLNSAITALLDYHGDHLRDEYVAVLESLRSC